MKVDNGELVDLSDGATPVNTSSEFVSKSILNITDIQLSNSNRNIECWFQPKEGAEQSANITLDVIGESLAIGTFDFWMIH
jgi:hypothetical protein